MSAAASCSVAMHVAFPESIVWACISGWKVLHEGGGGTKCCLLRVAGPHVLTLIH